MIVDAPTCEIDSALGCEKTSYQKGGANAGFPILDHRLLLIDGEWHVFDRYNYALGMSGRQANMLVYAVLYSASAVGFIGIRRLGKRE